MKKFFAFIVALALLPAFSFAANTAGGDTSKNTATTTSNSSGKVTELAGDVFIARGANTAHQAVKEETIIPGSAISTGANGRVVLKFEDGQVVTMQANSTFLVREYRYEPKHIENSRIVFSLLKGGLRFLTGLIGQTNKQAFRLATPNATIGIRGTDFMVVMANQSMYSQVVSGNIGMTNVAGTVPLSAGQTAYVASASALATLIPASAIPPGTFSQLLSIPSASSPARRAAPSTSSTTSPAPIASAASIAAGSAATSAGVGGGTAAAGIVSGTGVAAGVLTGIAGAASASSSSKQAPTVDANKTAAAVIAQSTLPKESQSVKKGAGKTETAEGNYSGMGVTGKVGTLGLGAELNYGLSDSFSTRVGFNTFSYNRNANSSQINYDFKIQLQSLSALADWYPFTGGFRTTVGLLYDNNKISLSANTTGGSYIINGTTYNPTDIGPPQVALSFNKVAPYFGIGWGNPVGKDKGWGLVTDVGILFQGKPKVDMTVTCFTPGVCNSLQNDATAENTKLQNDLSNFKFWPVASIGISYQW